MTAAVTLAAGRVPMEASGGITLDDLPAVAATGVRYVAMGQLTHSAPAADLSLKRG
jgi:nicotinate-nucleotide pyrophosphorylase (carboxylating)